MAALNQYSRQQVAAHNTPEDLWMIIHDKVYDLTKFQKEHPGGEEVLVDVAGKDSTREFDDIGHSSDAKEQMKSFCIGELVESERKQKPSAPGQNKCCKKAIICTGSAIAIGIGALIIVKALQMRKNL